MNHETPRPVSPGVPPPSGSLVAGPAVAPPAPPPRGRDRRRGWLLTVLAATLVLFALLLPNRPDRIAPADFLRVPVEALAGAALLVALPRRPGRAVATVLGITLALLTVLRLLDLGFYTVLGRPFDPVLDWSYLGNATDYLRTSNGPAAAVAAAALTALLAVGLLVLIPLAILRLGRVARQWRTRTSQALVVLTAGWLAGALLGSPVADRDTARLAYGHALQVGASLHDQTAYRQELAKDAFRDVPGSRLLTALHGKDVILTFVESYGRSALADPGVAAALDGGTRRLAAAGYSARSGFLTSSTFGGSSWLGHASLLSGTWVDNQRRHDALMGSSRLTLTRAFRTAGWRTVAVLPGTTQPWPEGSFFGYDRIYTGSDLGYRGPKFGWATIPDQFTLAAFHQRELAAPHRPLMAEVVLVSSHGPWAPIPRMLDWSALGDGSVYDTMPAQGVQAGDIWPDQGRVRAAYARSIEYSMDSLLSYLTRYGTKDTVLILLGDHQPATIISGKVPSRDVPVTVVAHDPAVLQRIASWDWTAGLRPEPTAPVWRMDAFRDRFLSAFSPAARAGTP
ncbi:MAG TPA: sulfatase-like hydrolase/transferase [Dermatophilaceae bacterium]|nr:sulfatase-like hydrolase/transferase [Dermatophilaceae bacterium]